MSVLLDEIVAHKRAFSIFIKIINQVVENYQVHLVGERYNYGCSRNIKRDNLETAIKLF